MNTAQCFANECKEDYAYYWNKAKTTTHLRRLYVQLAWNQRKYMRKWVALA